LKRILKNVWYFKKDTSIFYFSDSIEEVMDCEKDMTFKKSMANKTEEEDLEWLQKIVIRMKIKTTIIILIFKMKKLHQIKI